MLKVFLPQEFQVLFKYYMQHYLTNSSFPHCWVCFFAAAGLGHLGLGAMHDSSSSASSIQFSLLIRKFFFSI